MTFKSLKAAWIIAAVSLVVVSGFAFLAISQADSTTLKTAASGDTYVSTAYPNTVYGYWPSFWVSKAGTTENWGLMSFNVYSVLSSSAVIVSARIRLIVNDSWGQFPAVMTTGRLLAPFSESTTTFSNMPASSFEANTSTMFSKRPMAGFTVFVDVTPQIMKWRASGQIGGFGVEFKMDPATANAGVAFASRENPNPTSQPFLQIFTVPPGQYGYVPATSGVLAARTDA